MAKTMTTAFPNGRALGPLGAFALTLAFSLASPPASATLFMAFLEHSADFDVMLKGDGYPGRMKLLNHRNRGACVYFRYLDDANEVLRLSPIGARVPAGNQNLGVTGPGVNARRLDILVGEPQGNLCGRFAQVADQGLLSVRSGEVKQGSGFEVDARSWSGNSRDITVHIR